MLPVSKRNSRTYPCTWSCNLMLRKCKKQFKTKTSIGEMSQINLLAILAQIQNYPDTGEFKINHESSTNHHK